MLFGYEREKKIVTLLRLTLGEFKHFTNIVTYTQIGFYNLPSRWTKKNFKIDIQTNKIIKVPFEGNIDIKIVFQKHNLKSSKIPIINHQKWNKCQIMPKMPTFTLCQKYYF